MYSYLNIKRKFEMCHTLYFRADINAQNSGTLWTALHSSAFQGHGPVILKLMSYKPNLSIKDHKGR